MKKFGLFKRIGLSATAFFVCLAVLITCLTFIPPVAFAAEGDGTTTPTTVKVNDGKAFATSDGDVALKSSYTYGDIITVPAGATVVLPNGKEAKVTDGKVEAAMLGVYKIRYTDATSGVHYDFKTSVTLEEDYFLYIEYNGADIPTYVESNKDSAFTLPDASVMFYNEQNILVEYPDRNYTVEIEDSLGNKYTDSKTFDPSDKQGKVFITYTATLEDNGTKRLSKTFTVNVQSKVTSGGNPTLAVSGIQKDASVNRPFTLPVANVSDKNDDNVKVVIEVFEPDGNTKVHNVKVNDDGYATETLESEVKFDNDKSMTFYPTATGKYKVQYTAYNDSYNKDNPTAGGKSSTYESIIEVADHVAPVFKNTDNYEYLIPETWGLEVKDENGTVSGLGGTITFKVPEVVDNKDYVSAADAPEGKKGDLITMLFRITDSDNNKTILEIPNILSTGDDSKLKNNGIYDADVEFNVEHDFEFDFNNYKRKDKNDSEVSKALPGTYTVLFRARDKANNTSSKTYTITLKDKYEDKAKPSTAEVTAPEYLSEADESFTVPRPVYADGDDTRPQVTYRIYSSANKYLDVKGGEEAKIVRDGGLKLVINEGMDGEATMAVDGDSLYFYVGVKDKVGNYRTNAVDDDGNYFYLTDNDENYTKVTAVTKLIRAPEDGKKFSYNDKINFVNAKGDETIKAGNSVNAGSFVITAASEDMRYYTGFEVAVYDPQDNYLDVTLQTLSDIKDDGSVVIYVKDITFTTSSAALGDDHYTMTVRVFDVNGYYEVYTYQLGGVLNAKGDGTSTSAIANIGKTGNVNVTYKLNNSVINNIQEEGTFRVIRKISGGIFSVMGNELTAYTSGSYTIQDGYINAKDINDGVFNYDDVKDDDGNVVTQSPVKFDSVNKGIHYVDIVDTAKPVIELLDKAPVYENVYDEKKGEIAEGNGLITVPEAIAYTENGMGTIKIDVTDPDGSDDVDWDEETRTFHATKNGVYKVTYTATYESGEVENYSFDVNVGKVTAPRFTVSGGTSTAGTKKEGDTFTFKTLNLLEGESSDGVQIRKELYYNNEILSANTVSGSYSGYASKGNNGTEIKLNKVGEYTIVYTAKDEYGNEYKITENVTVTSKGSSSPTTWTTLSTVLIIVAIVLLAGVIVYVVRFRKVKK